MNGENTGPVVVLTALGIEYAAVRAQLTDLRPERHPSGTIFEIGSRPGRPGSVVLAETGVGNHGAAVIAERAITQFSPQAMLLVGIAGALHNDLELGDVVVASKIYGYHGGTETTDGMLARPQAWEAPHSLLELTAYLRRTGRLTVAPVNGRPASVHFRPIAAGEVVLNSRSTPLASQLNTHYNDAAAVEMESAGTAKAAHLNALPSLTIRGISDKASDEKLLTDAAGYQGVAADRATAVAVAVLDELLGVTVTAPPLRVGVRISEATATGRNTGAVGAGITTDALGFAALPPGLPEVTWRNGLADGRFGRSGQERAALELHLLPAAGPARLEMRTFGQLPDQLVQLGRANGLFTPHEGLEPTSNERFAWVRGTGYEPGPRGLAVGRDGQRSAWCPLPADGLGSVLDPTDLPARIETLIRMLLDMPVPEPSRVAFGMAIAPAHMVSEDRVATMPRSSGRMPLNSVDQILVHPEDVLGFEVLRERANDVVDELTSRLIAAVRSKVR